MKISITGLHGSGKTTQARLLSGYVKVPLVDVGEMLRTLSDQDNEEGKKVKYALDQGLMVDDEVVAKLASERVKERDCQNGFVMDGYPLTLHQMKLFDPYFDKVFYLDITEDVAEERLLGRARKDDTLDLIKKRLELYYKFTQPIIDHYSTLGLVEKIDGLGSIEEVNSRIRERVDG